MRRVLIANRGEIAVRIARACRERGIESVAVYSDADAGAPHTLAADQAIHIGATPAHHSYLSIERIIEAAHVSGADALHPGYGFLSENPLLVEACERANLTFIGPSAASMRALGDKAKAKDIAAQCDVPTVPQWAANAIPHDAYPVLVKAVAGGGGRGMRVVRSESERDEAMAAAAREALAGFGDDALIVEALVSNARHVEIQLLADMHGTCLYIGDRDCSLQRRHQKVVEEAPAPRLPDGVRTAMGEAAVRIAQAAGYVGAGTAEFLVADTGEFYFLELNARLQVEHPATELAFGIDLVDWQLRIADGDHLTLAQADIRPRRHAIEARLYAEDPVTFLPTGGHVVDVRLPRSDNVRIDHALAAGRDVTLAYDPLLAKIIAHGTTREEARAALLDALRTTMVLGCTTNNLLLQHVLELGSFVDATHTINTLTERPMTEDEAAPPAWLEAEARAALSQHLLAQRGAPLDPFVSTASSTTRPDAVATRGDMIWAAWEGGAWEFARSALAQHGKAQAGLDDHGDVVDLVAPMPGTVLQIVEPGTEVRVGEPVIVLEAMKMENAISAPFDGIIDNVTATAGAVVTRGHSLARITRSHA